MPVPNGGSAIPPKPKPPKDGMAGMAGIGAGT
jgi:hypothetical protein